MRLPRWTPSREVWIASGLLALWGFGPFVALLVEVELHGGVLSGSDGGAASADQFQYMAWVRDSGARGLIWNSFELAPSHAVFLQPMFLLSGLAVRLGSGIQLAYLIWKPVAIAALVLGFAAYAARSDPGNRRLAILVLALFCLSPLLPALDWANLLHRTRFHWVLGVEELSPVWQLWGYPATAIAIGLMAVALLASERAVTCTDRHLRRWLGLAAGAGALVAWLHPWQGATLVLIWLGLFTWSRGGRSYRGLILAALATSVPLIYYEILDHVDSAWKLAQAQNTYPHLALWELLGALAPLALPALVALRAPPRGVLGRITRLWLGSGMVIYFGTRTFPEHALQGLSLPLAVLAVDGWRRLRLGRRWAVVGIALVTIPGAIWSASFHRDSVRSHVAPYIFTAQEHAALTFLERSRAPGGVLAGEYLGMAVPAFAARNTWRGHDVWTPDFALRDRLAAALLSGQMAVGRARRLVQASGAGFLLADCSQRGDLRSELGPLIAATWRFGCVTVYRLAPGSALAASGRRGLTS